MIRIILCDFCKESEATWKHPNGTRCCDKCKQRHVKMTQESHLPEVKYTREKRRFEYDDL